MIRDRPRARVRGLIDDYAVAYTFLRMCGHSREYAEATAVRFLEDRINLTKGRPDLVRGRPQEGTRDEDR